MTKDEDRDRASLDRVLSVIDAIPSDRRDDETETISVGALRLLRAAFAADRLEALARPVVGVQIPMALMQAVEDFINEPQRSPDIEPMEVRDYRHALYRVWSPLCQAILTANTAALAASPSPVVGDREALQEAHDAIDQALDDMGAQGHCVCPEAKDWLGSARTKAANALSTPVVGGDQGLRNSARAAVMYLETGFIECEQCGHEVQTKDLDATYELRDALAALSAPVTDAPDPHTMDRAGMAQEVE